MCSSSSWGIEKKPLCNSVEKQSNADGAANNRYVKRGASASPEADPKAIVGVFYSINASSAFAKLLEM